ncbi:MAG: class I SAM-dependent methyltransferase [Acidobacteria bacterium]|nr:class I SAM-dependent methyltransferase [Acidobacteriota bacterium]
MSEEQGTRQTRAIYDRNARDYDRRAAIMERMVLGALRVRLWASAAGGRLLEVGVGTGINIPFYPPAAHVTGVDFSPAMLALARNRAERNGSLVSLMEMDIEHLRFNDDSFDCVVSACVFCSVPAPLRGLREVRRVLKPGGKFLMLEHVRGPGVLGPIFDLLNPLAVRFGGANINRRTVENVQSAGLQIQSVEDHAFGIVKLIEATKGTEGSGR